MILAELDDAPPVTEATPFPSAELFAAYERVAAEIRALGPDVSIQPRLGYVAFYRKHEFALVKPVKGELQVGVAADGAGLEPATGLGGPERIRSRFSPSPDGALSDLGRAALRRAYESS